MKTMREELDERVVREAKLFLEDGANIRSVAQEVGHSKSTVAYDLRHRLVQAGRPDLHEQVASKLNTNRAEAPLRGARAMHEKVTN